MNPVPAATRCDDGPVHADPASREAARLDAFQRQHDISGPEAVALYLTNLVDAASLSARQVRYRLRLLDRAAEPSGQPLPSSERVVAMTLRSIRRALPPATPGETQPLYLEDITAMLDALRADRLPQKQDMALVLLANATGMTASSLRRLTWTHMRLGRDAVTVRVPPNSHSQGPTGAVTIESADFPRTVEALRELRRAAAPGTGRVFRGEARGAAEEAPTGPVLATAPGRGGSWTQSLLTAAPEPTLEPWLDILGQPRLSQLRDAALVSLAFTACLSSTEATRLTCGDIHTSAHGLRLNVPGRRGPTGVPYSRGRHCPVGYWLSWFAALERRGSADAAAPAFPAVHGHTIARKNGLDDLNMTHIVRKLCQEARLEGDFSFTSLRVGFVRTAIRAAVPEPLILQQAGLRTMTGLQTHVRREQLIADSVAGRLGL